MALQYAEKLHSVQYSPLLAYTLKSTLIVNANNIRTVQMSNQFKTYIKKNIQNDQLKKLITLLYTKSIFT